MASRVGAGSTAQGGAGWLSPPPPGLATKDGSNRQVQHDRGRMMHRRRLPPRRQDPGQTSVQTERADRVGEQQRPRLTDRRQTASHAARTLWSAADPLKRVRRAKKGAFERANRVRVRPNKEPPREQRQIPTFAWGIGPVPRQLRMQTASIHPMPHGELVTPGVSTRCERRQSRALRQAQCASACEQRLSASGGCGR